MVVAGIDPGLHGAIAVLDENEGLVLFDLPMHQVTTSSRKTRGELDMAAIAHFLRDLAPFIDHVFIERVSANPGQGVTSMFRFGYACGALHMVCAAYGIPHTFVTPQSWQKATGVGPGPDAARQRAAGLYPQHATSFTRKLDQHRADATLIARHGRAVLAQLDNKRAA
jgi:crossover junction endodeoxyribonuclease RuvC